MKKFLLFLQILTNLPRQSKIFKRMEKQILEKKFDPDLAEREKSKKKRIEKIIKS
ncbi:MAG: hypothetical protein CM15mV134_020 [uncultured marine virus]|nr:MAG: hypothetical protein CM15mV134_020 [uncultured marine virus]